MDDAKIKEIALENGFKLKDQGMGGMDLHSYVYDFAYALLAELGKDAARYRYLRDASLNNDRELDVCDDAMNVFFGEDLDMAIDDAIDAAKQERR